MIGVGAGYGYSIYGPTHHSAEDIGILRTLPNLTIVSPADALELKGILKASFHHRGPVYLRLPRRSVSTLYTLTPRISLGKAITIKPGRDGVICATGTMVERALEVAALLRNQGKEITVVSFPTIKPIDREAITKLTKEFRVILTLEPHSIIGGLGSAIAEVIASLPYHGVFRQFGYPDRFIHYAASEVYLDKQLKLDPPALALSFGKLLK